MAVTIKDVARLSGVNVSTVSRAFNSPELVSSSTRTRVIEVAEQLGYRPNRAARALITGRTHNIGLIVADIANPFFPPLIKAAESHARGRDYHVFVADSDENPAVEAELVLALAKQVDGILLCSPRMNNPQIVALSQEVPLVMVNRPVPGLPAVVMDVFQGTQLALNHLFQLGHKDILLVGGPRSSWTNKEIQRAARGLPVLGPNMPTAEGGFARAQAVLDSGATAVLAYNDLVAVGLIEGLASLGARVPEDISVVGVDNTIRWRPNLTTIQTPTAAAGRAAVDMLLQRTTALVTLQTSLIVGESTGPCGRPA
jgi:LacI family transcriptional regulator